MKVQFIDSDSELTSAVQVMEDQKSIAVDLEFDKNMFRYGFNLCLMQIKAGEDCFLIDPLSDKLNISLVFPVFEDESIQKIVFAFGEDLRLLHSINCTPKNMYDLSVAASILNYPPTSLTNLIDEVLGITVRKSAQRSNWFTRPLTEEQLNYAADDVLFLHNLKATFDKMAKEKKIVHWMEEEVQMLDKQSYHGIDNIELYRDKDKQGLTEVNWHVYKELVDYRDTLAKKINRPSYQIMDKDFLLALSKNTENISGWGRARVNPAFNNPEVKKKLVDVCESALKSAEKLGLSDTKSAIERLSKEDFLLKKKIHQQVEDVKTSIFKPIKLLIAQDYGENTAAFLLSSKTMESIINGDVDNIPKYRIELLKTYAKTFGIDISSYIK